MTGPKLNEKSFVAGERSGTKATAKYVRASASKARVVLDLIRDVDVTTADQVLQFTDRHIARDVRKVLASAVANAVNNDGQDADELFVVACFADEGPTLKRFRPRARGRASRINKRSCHITVIVARMSDQRIAVIQARQERAGGTAGRGRPQSSAASRRARVERSRTKDAPAASSADTADATDADADTDAEATDVEATDTTDVDVTDTAVAAGTAVETPYGPGSAAPADDGSGPDGYDVKGNADSMLFHTTDSPYYGRTKAEAWFESEAAAEAAGFARWDHKSTEAAEADTAEKTEADEEPEDVTTTAEATDDVTEEPADVSTPADSADDEGAV
jgi:large subunit ribosomal protein L22